MYTFLVDPRICLLTGKELRKGHHSCCGIQYDYVDNLVQYAGLSGEYQSKVRHSQFRSQLMNEDESETMHLPHFIGVRYLEKSGPELSVKRLFQRTIKDRLLGIPKLLGKTVHSFLVL